MRILIVEGEEEQPSLHGLFTVHGHDSVRSAPGADVVRKCDKAPPDMIVWRVSTELNDVEWARLEVLLRREHRPYGVVVIGTPGTPSQAARCLNHGADDFVRSPWDERELLARVTSVLRRVHPQNKDPVIDLDHLSIDLRSKQVSIDGRTIRLAPKAYALLHLLACDPGRVFSAHEIIAHVWPNRRSADQNDVKQCIHTLRQRLEIDPANPRLICNSPGFGYFLDLNWANAGGEEADAS
ncbi:MAG: response regulator transcription factor [Gammaproteobacteria bacterium]